MVESLLRFTLVLFGLENDKKQKQCCFKSLASGMLPLILSITFAGIWRWYYRYNQMFSFDFNWRVSVLVICDIMVVWSHRVARRDPGFLQVPSEPNTDDTDSCKKCGALKTELVHHCSLCDRCTFLMDHHCWWTNNCVGYYSFKPFMLFAFYIALLCGFGAVTCLHHFMTTNIVHGEGLQGFFGVYRQIFSLQNAIQLVTLNVEDPLAYLDIFLMQMCMMFFEFAVVMSGAMIHASMENESQIEAHKSLEDLMAANRLGQKYVKEQLPRRSLMQAIYFIFGQDHLSWHMLVPVNVRPKLTDEIVRQATKDRRMNQPGRVLIGDRRLIRMT